MSFIISRICHPADLRRLLLRNDLFQRVGERYKENYTRDRSLHTWRSHTRRNHQVTICHSPVLPSLSDISLQDLILAYYQILGTLRFTSSHQNKFESSFLIHISSLSVCPNAWKMHQRPLRNLFLESMANSNFSYCLGGWWGLLAAIPMLAPYQCIRHSSSDRRNEKSSPLPADERSLTCILIEANSHRPLPIS